MKAFESPAARAVPMTWALVAALLVVACGGGNGAGGLSEPVAAAPGSAADATAPAGSPAVGSASPAVPVATPPAALPAGAELWSAPATWGGKVPVAGQVVNIAAGQTIVLDTVTPDLGGLVVEGNLIVADGSTVELRSRYILIMGTAARFAVGSSQTPFSGSLKIALTGSDASQDISGMGTKFLGTHMGGTIELYGAPKLSWTRIDAHANKGQSELTLARDPVGWKAGDTIAIAPTDYEPMDAETRQIVSLQGRRVTLDQPLSRDHWGTLQSISGITIDQRAEVANLSRNITVSGEADSAGSFGGHMMFMSGGTARLQDVEVTRMGQLGTRGRYPVHFHMMGDGGANSSVVNSVIHHSFQRGLVVHQTNQLKVTDNVVFDTVGMQYFLEDGVEIDNVFERNLGLLARHVPNDKSLSSERIDRGDGGPGPERVAAFWITNQHNVFRDNVAVGVESGWGFAFRDSDVTPANRALTPLPANADQLANLPQSEFSGNYARTISFRPQDIFNLGYGPEEAGSCFRFGGGGGGGPVPVTNASAFKCVNAAFWGTGGRPLDNITVADARAAVVQDQGVGFAPLVRHGRIVAYSNNDPLHVATDTTYVLHRGPFGQHLFEATDAGATQLVDTQLVGAFGSGGFSPLSPSVQVAAAAQRDGDFRLAPAATALLGMLSGSTATLPITVVRGGWQGPIDIRLPDYSAEATTSGLTAEPLTIAAGASTGTLVLHASNPQRAGDPASANPKTFDLNLLSSGGGQTKIDTRAVIEIASDAFVSKPGIDVAHGYDTSSPRGLSNMEGNRGVNFAFDGTDEYAEASGAQPWAEIVFDQRIKIGQIRLWQPPANQYNSLGENFVVLVSDFALIGEDMTLADALALPFVRAFDLPGRMGVKGSPTVIDLPAGTTARSVRVWKRTSENLRIQEMQIIGG